MIENGFVYLIEWVGSLEVKIFYRLCLYDINYASAFLFQKQFPNHFAFILKLFLFLLFLVQFRVRLQRSIVTSREPFHKEDINRRLVVKGCILSLACNKFSSYTKACFNSPIVSSQVESF